MSVKHDNKHYTKVNYYCGFPKNEIVSYFVFSVCGGQFPMNFILLL